MDDQRGWLRPFIRMLPHHWRAMATGTICGMIGVAASIGLLALSGWFLSATAFAALSAVTAANFNYFFPSIGVRIFAIVRTLGRYGERVFSHDATFRLLESLRTWFYRHIEPLAPARLMQFRSGELLSRIVADIDALDNLYLRVISPSIIAFAVALVVTAFLWHHDGIAALTAFIGFVLAGRFVPWLADVLARNSGRALAQQSASLRTFTVEGIQGLVELLVYGRRTWFQSRLDRKNRSFLATQKQMSIIGGFSTALLTLLSGATVLLILYRGAGMISRGQLNGANLALVALAVLATFEAVMLLPPAFQYLSRTRAAARRLLEVVETEPTVHFPRQSQRLLDHFDIQFEGVDFRYQPNLPPALADIDLTIPSGECIAIVGETGAGKSTLIHLLARFWNPDRGSIRIGGDDIRLLSESDLRQTLTIVSQQAYLFNASIRSNLLMGNANAKDQDLCDALDTVRLSAFVADLPHGLDTWVGESGQLLSGGQARRLALARALLHDAPIWILDEPTEGLDRQTAQEIMQILLSITRARTFILITHQPFELARMDRIAFMENGRLAALGTHDALRQSHPEYTAISRRLF